MENHSYNQVIGSTSAPYENSLARACGLATNYHGITHPSLPNYMAGTGGTTAGITTDCSPSASCESKGASIFGQVSASGRQWRSYQESMPSKCDLSSARAYAVKHNPAAYYTAIRSQCRSWDEPFGTTSSGAFVSDLSAGRLPAFSFVTPNLCHDTHDCSVATGDAWLKAVVGRIVGSATYHAGRTAIVITWDEGFASSNQVPTIVVAPSTRAGTRSSTRFDHYSLLRTTEEMLGRAKIGHAATATSMRAAFHL
jgi:phospholipase C